MRYVNHRLKRVRQTDKNIALKLFTVGDYLLRNADHLVFMNIDFSAVSYFQTKDRMTTLDEKKILFFGYLQKNGIEEKDL